METFYGNFFLHICGFPGLAHIFALWNYQLKLEAIRILKSEDIFSKLLRDPVVGNIEFLKAFFPEFQAAIRNGIANSCGHSCTVRALFYPWPRKESQDASRGPYSVTKVKMVDLGIVKIHGFFQHTQPEYFGVKIIVPLCISRNGGNVM